MQVSLSRKAHWVVQQGRIVKDSERGDRRPSGLPLLPAFCLGLPAPRGCLQQVLLPRDQCKITKIVLCPTRRPSLSGAPNRNHIVSFSPPSLVCGPTDFVSGNWVPAIEHLQHAHATSDCSRPRQPPRALPSWALCCVSSDAPGPMPDRHGVFTIAGTCVWTRDNLLENGCVGIWGLEGKCADSQYQQGAGLV
ncbi:hypothetical protein VTK26DRAFT_58 [Humicola hyalothermophila]